MLDVDRAVDTLSAPIAPGVPRSWPDGAPAHEWTRSPAAARVGTLAADVGLFLFHFEHRLPLDLPEAWVDAAAGDDAVPPPWIDGVLAERKYQAFRHDLSIGSFHPGHRAKWTAHELCHALVGFGWRPDAPPLWHATAGRLAELLPVVLWYFLDEVGLRRCDVHGEPQFRTFCPACEEAAVAGPRPLGERDVAAVRDATRFLDRELAAVARTRRLGRPVPHVWGSLDLCSDGIAYAHGHGLRLTSPAFHRYVERFAVRGGGWLDDLDALEERVVEVARGLAEGTPVAPLAPSPEAGRARWIRQDLGHRLLQVHSETGGPAADALMEVVDALAGGASVTDTRAAYTALTEDVELPPAQVVFAVGYDLPGGGRAVAQVEEGLATVVPVTLALLEDAGMRSEAVATFVADDSAVRRTLGDRFADWLRPRVAPVVADLVAWEVALRHGRGEPEAVVLGPGEGHRWARGVRHVRSTVDIAAAAEGADAGELSGVQRGGVLTLEPELVEVPTALVVGRDRTGDVVVAEVPADLPVGDLTVWPPEVLDALVELELVVADHW